MAVEKPAQVDCMPVELDFLYDMHGEWCLALARQRSLKQGIEKSDTYPNFIKSLHHVIMGNVKEFYRIIRVKEKIIKGTRNIINPLKIGFSEKLDCIVKDDMSTLIIDNLDRFVPVSRGTHDVIPIVLNPDLHNFHQMTQEYLLLDGVGLREWIEVFSQRKGFFSNFLVAPLYGENNVRWLSHAQPRRLSVLLSELPKASFLSALYSSQFVFPIFSLGSVDIAQVSQTMEINSNRAEPLAKMINSPVTSSNYDDFRRIMLALTLPQQLMVDIEFNSDDNFMLRGMIGLMSKMLFSTTPGFRTVTMRSARQVDREIGSMLVRLGYVNDDARFPLRVHSYGPGDRGAVWAQLESHDVDGLGWVNHETQGMVVIVDALYDGVNELPMYAGLDQYVHDDDAAGIPDIVPPHPPIFDLIIRCLGEASIRKVREDGMAVLINYVAPRWMQFFLNLNRFIILYGETGFWLSDGRRNEMEQVMSVGGLDGSLNAPTCLKVKSDSIYKFMLRLPIMFTPNERILRQPSAESVTCAELQRIISLFVCIYDWIRADGVQDAYTSRRCLKLIIESIESNHIAKKIFDYCFSGGDIQRVDPQDLANLVGLFDDFEARFFGDMMLIIRDNLELFGFTEDVVFDTHLLMVPQGPEYDAARRTGIIASNIADRALRVVEMGRNDLIGFLGRKSLRTRIQQLRDDDILTTLPIYVAYREEE